MIRILTAIFCLVSTSNAVGFQVPSCNGIVGPFGYSEPENEGINVQELLNLTRWVKTNSNLPLLSILISKNGRVVYELYTSSLVGEEAHYLNSVTK